MYFQASVFLLFDQEEGDAACDKEDGEDAEDDPKGGGTCFAGEGVGCIGGDGGGGGAVVLFLRVSGGGGAFLLGGRIIHYGKDEASIGNLFPRREIVAGVNDVIGVDLYGVAFASVFGSDLTSAVEADDSGGACSVAAGLGVGADMNRAGKGTGNIGVIGIIVEGGVGMT